MKTSAETLFSDPSGYQRVAAAIERLSDGVRAHIEAVRAKSVALAERHGVDVVRAEVAAVSHDICRITKAEELLRMAPRFGITVTALDRAFPVFLHGPVGAEVLKRDYGLRDEAVLSAIRVHTMGRADMTPLDKILFLADKLDPSKVKKYPFIAQVDRLAAENLDAAMVCFIDHQVQAYIANGDLVHPGMMAARNDAVLKGELRDSRPQQRGGA